MVSDEFGHLQEYREVTGTPRGLNGPTWALVEERGGSQEVGCTPIRMGRGPDPPFLLLLFPFLPPPIRTRKGGNLLLVGVAIPPWGRTMRAGRPPPPLLYIRGMGAPHRHRLTIVLAMYGAPLHRYTTRSYRRSA